MYVSLRWVEHLLGLQDLSLVLLTERLTLGGFEIESIQTKRNNKYYDIILDISFTANRYDLTNIKNFFFELSSLFAKELPFQKSLNINTLILNKNKQKYNPLLPFEYFLQNNQKFNISICDSHYLKTTLQLKEFFFKYSVWEKFLQKKVSLSLKMDYRSNNYYIPYCHQRSNAVSIKESPKWIRKRLLLMNFSPINNIIDTINYILIETGQVFFVYDSRCLKNLTNTESLDFVAKFSDNSETFMLSKQQNIFLNPNVLTLQINNKVISLFGFIQNFHTIITDNTSEFILQAGVYDSRQVKQISQLLGIRTEYSIKLEKQNDLNLLEQAYLRLIYLLKVQGIHFLNFSVEESRKKTLTSLISYYVKKSQLKINVFYKNIDRLIGPSKFKKGLKYFQLLNNLRFLNFKIYFITDKNFFIKAPFQRQLDIEEKVDIIEEIVRILGFNSIKPILPIKNPLGKLTKLEKFKRLLKNLLLNLGITESIHSIFSKKTFLLESSLQNPLINEASVLRVSLVNSLIDKILLNKNLARDNFEIFEFGRTYKYLSTDKSSKKEIEFLCGIIGGKVFRSNWEEGYSTINWFEAKGVLENLFKELNIAITWIPAQIQVETFYHPTRTAYIISQSEFIGTFGEVHPDIILKENINNDLYLFEFNIETLHKVWKNKTVINYIPYSIYPVCYVDLTCICKRDKTLSFFKIKDSISNLGQPLLTSIDLLDYYSKPPIKEGFYSLTFKLGFTSKKQTLLSLDVNKVVNRIKEELLLNFNIKIK
ncbi:unnamed protein product [Dictyota dichotoma]